MKIFLLGLYVTYDASLCDLVALGYFTPMDEKTSISHLDVPHALEKAANLVGYALAPFNFIGTLHEVPVFLGLDHFGAYD